jgi:hypothetical protein
MDKHHTTKEELTSMCKSGVRNIPREFYDRTGFTRDELIMYHHMIMAKNIAEEKAREKAAKEVKRKEKEIAKENEEKRKEKERLESEYREYKIRHANKPPQPFTLEEYRKWNPNPQIPKPIPMSQSRIPEIRALAAQLAEEDDEDQDDLIKHNLFDEDDEDEDDEITIDLSENTEIFGDGYDFEIIDDEPKSKKKKKHKKESNIKKSSKKSKTEKVQKQSELKKFDILQKMESTNIFEKKAVKVDKVEESVEQPKYRESDKRLLEAGMKMNIRKKEKLYKKLRDLDPIDKKDVHKINDISKKISKCNNNIEVIENEIGTSEKSMKEELDYELHGSRWDRFKKEFKKTAKAVGKSVYKFTKRWGGVLIQAAATIVSAIAICKGGAALVPQGS